MAVMLDSAFGIFNNVSPRFQWAEIDLTFPSDDGYFAVANYEELMAHSLFPVRKMKIKDAFLVLFSPPEKAEEGLTFLRRGKLTALDMQMLIHCKANQFTLLLPNTNISKLSTRMSGHLHSQILSLFCHPPTSTPSFNLSKRQCTTGRLSGTKSRQRLERMSGTSLAFRKQRRLITMLCRLLCRFLRRSREGFLLFRVIVRKEVI
jgi:hypothetical protein